MCTLKEEISIFPKELLEDTGRNDVTTWAESLMVKP